MTPSSKYHRRRTTTLLGAFKWRFEELNPGADPALGGWTLIKLFGVDAFKLDNPNVLRRLRPILISLLDCDDNEFALACSGISPSWTLYREGVLQ